MKSRLVVLGLLLLATVLLASTGFFAPQEAQAFVQDPGPIDGGGGGGLCTKSNCLTTCTGPTGVECCCYYTCPSGGTWVCKSGYCPETSRSCGPK